MVGWRVLMVLGTVIASTLATVTSLVSPKPKLLTQLAFFTTEVLTHSVLLCKTQLRLGYTICVLFS